MKGFLGMRKPFILFVSKIEALLPEYPNATRFSVTKTAPDGKKRAKSCGLSQKQC